MKHITLRLFSCKFKSEELSKNILNFLEHYKKTDLMPEKFDTSEPPKMIYNKSSKKEAIRLLSIPHCATDLKRITRPKYYCILEGYGYLPIKMGGKIINKKIDRKIMTELIAWFVFDKDSDSFDWQEILISLAEILGAEYGFVTLQEDYDLKNHVVAKIRGGTFESYTFDTLEEDGIPGMYWMNYFGKNYIKEIGISKLNNIDCENIHNTKDFCVIQFSKKLSDSQEKKVLEKQEKSKKIIGIDLFNPSEQIKKMIIKRGSNIEKKIKFKIKIPEFLK